LKRLWNEECDMVFKYYMLVIKTLYEKFSGKFTLPGTPKYIFIILFKFRFMSLEELNTLALSAEVLDEQFG